MKNRRQSVTLIIAIMMMLIFALLGTTLLRMQATGLTVNRQGIDSERAFYLAESGAEWALNQVSGDAGYRDTKIHQLNYGEYEVTVRDAQAGEEGDAIVESVGYVPSKNGYRAQRKVRMIVITGNVQKVVQVKNLFDWSDAGADSHTKINDDIAVGVEGEGYEGDGDGIRNELGEDYGEGVPPKKGERRFFPQSAFPEIDMDYFQTNAKRIFPDPLNRVISTKISNISGDIIDVDHVGFFDDMKDEAVKNLEIDGWGSNAWRAIIDVPDGFDGKRAQLDSSVAGIWNGGEDGDKIRLIKRVYKSLSVLETLLSGKRYYYIKSDFIVDARDNNVIIWYTSYVAEKDIVITGDNKVSMRAHILLASYPLFATKDGNIISFAPQTGNEQNKMKKRAFYGLIYTQNGNIHFHYLYGIVGSWRGVALMANNLYLYGRVQIDYSSYFIGDYGFNFQSSGLYWREE